MLQKFQARLNKDYYYIIRRDFNKKINQFSFVQAVRFIFLIHTSYNGIYRVNKKGEYNVPVGKLKPCLATKENLIKISKKLKLAEIRNCHYSDIFDFANKNDFVYLDPPYPPLNGKSYFQHYTVDKFPAHEQEKLAEFTNQLDKKGVNVLISNANTSFIRNLYKPWDMTKLKTIRFVSCKSKRNKVVELLIKNY